MADSKALHESEGLKVHSCGRPRKFCLPLASKEHLPQYMSAKASNMRPISTNGMCAGCVHTYACQGSCVQNVCKLCAAWSASGAARLSALQWQLPRQDATPEQADCMSA